MIIQPEHLDELLQDYQNPSGLLGSEGTLNQLTAALVERCLDAEVKTHLEEHQADSVSDGKTILAVFPSLTESNVTDIGSIKQPT